MTGRNNVTEVMEFVAERTINLVKSNSVLGEPFQKDGMTIVPVSKLSVSFAGGGADIVDNSHKKHNQPTGGGAKVDMVPMSFLVIKDNDVKVVNVDVKEKSNVDQIIEVIIGTAKQLFNKKS